MPYRIKQDDKGHTPQYSQDGVNWTNLSEPKPLSTMAEWVIDNHAKGASNTSESYREYKPSNKIPLHD